MSVPFIGEVRIFAGNFAPAGWAFCDGSLLPISENDALFNLIGTTYGGDGQTTFALPDLRGRVPMHQGVGPGLSNRVIGQTLGRETVTLLTPQIPQHTHPAVGSTTVGTSTSPAATLWAQTPEGVRAYATQVTGSVDLATAAVESVGGGQPHNNMQPYLVISYIISLFGIFPPRN